MGETSKALALDRCKLCGGEAQYWTGSRRILCSKCGMQTPPVDCLAKAMVIWNRSAARRPEQEPEPVALVEEARTWMRTASIGEQGERYIRRLSQALLSALYASPQAGEEGASAPDSGLVRRSDVIDLLSRIANEHADLAVDGGDNARGREAAEAALTRVKYAVAFLPALAASPAPAAPTDHVPDAGKMVSTAAQTDWADHEDEISDAIGDSIDMGWTSRDGAKAVVRYLKGLSND